VSNNRRRSWYDGHVDGTRIRVLVTAFANVPGSSPHAAALLAMIASVRADIDMVTVKTETSSHVERIGDARMFRVPVGDQGPLEQRVVFDRAVGRQLEAETYDVVHVRGPFEGSLAADRKSTYGFQLVYEMGTFPDEALGAEVEKRWAEAHERCLEAADLVLVPTEAARRGVTERVAAERVLVLAPGVDVGAYDWRPHAQATLPRLLYLGAFTADRDVATVLGAVKRVSATREVRALIAGEPNRGRRERVRQMVDAFGLRDVVDVRGEPAAVAAVIAGADVCIAPASEAPRFQVLGDLPQPLLEYLACHRPVVAAGVPGVAEVLRDEQEGLLYPPGDEAALAEAILEMLRDATLAERLTEQGYRRVRELFSSGARRRRIGEVYERLVPGSQGTDPWEDGFGEDETGEIQPAGSAPELDDAGASDAPPELEPDPDPEPEHTENLETLDADDLQYENTHGGTLTTDVGLHSSEMPARMDTDPGVVNPGEPLGAEKTRPRAPDTDPGSRA
jgi:glycosyltransferase involved in cell wall biosynthesis